MSQDWNDSDFQTSIARDAMESDRKIEELESKVKDLESQVAKLESGKADLRTKLDRALAAGLKALQHKAAADRRSHRLETEYKAQLEEAKLHNSKEVEPLRASVAELRSLMTRVCDIAWEYQDA